MRSFDENILGEAGKKQNNPLKNILEFNSKENKMGHYLTFPIKKICEEVRKVFHYQILVSKTHGKT